MVMVFQKLFIGVKSYVKGMKYFTLYWSSTLFKVSPSKQHCEHCYKFQYQYQIFHFTCSITIIHLLLAIIIVTSLLLFIFHINNLAKSTRALSQTSTKNYQKVSCKKYQFDLVPAKQTRIRLLLVFSSCLIRLLLIHKRSINGTNLVTRSCLFITYELS